MNNRHKDLDKSFCSQGPYDNGGAKYGAYYMRNRLGEKTSKTGTPPTPDRQDDIFSFKKHSMDYFTISGVMLRTGYRDQKYWYILVIKELLDNAVDFLWKHYQGYSDTSITVNITKNDSLLHIKIRNSNSKNISVFQRPDLIFDPEMRYGSKQDVRTISRGMLGDALKQILALGYVIIHSSDDGTAFTNDQWNNPLIIRCNGKEIHVRIIVDTGNQTHMLEIKDVKFVDHNDTELEVLLPIKVHLDIKTIVAFCRHYPLLTTDISFRFRIVDNSTDSPDDDYVETKFPNTLGEKIVQSVSSPARKAAIKIEFPALHPIPSEWNNTWTIHTLMPDEFVSMITGVYDKPSVTVYERLQSGREGNNMKKTDENKMSIAEFISKPDYRKKLQKIFWDMKAAMPSPKELSLPYRDNKQRKQALVSRICGLYHLLDADKAVYRVIRGVYSDDKDKTRRVYDSKGNYTLETGKGILQYPLAIEFLVIPYTNKSLEGRDTHRASEFIGSVNYSLSPRSNEFDGAYSWFDKKGHPHFDTGMKGILQSLEFCFYETSGPKVKIPSIILVNIICQRVDYHGHDKSRIDTHPFTDTIIQAAKKIAESVKTFRAEGFVFRGDMEHEDAPKAERRMSAKRLFEIFLNRVRDGDSLDVRHAGDLEEDE